MLQPILIQPSQKANLVGSGKDPTFFNSLANILQVSTKEGSAILTPNGVKFHRSVKAFLSSSTHGGHLSSPLIPKAPTFYTVVYNYRF